MQCGFRSKLRWGACVSVLAVGAAGCSDDDDPCKSPAECDIQNAECQAQVFEATACARDQNDATMPPVRRQTVEEFRAQIVGEQEEPGDEARAWDAALTLLTLLPESASSDDAGTDVSVDNVAAYYDDETEQVTILERDDGAVNREQDVFTLSHEFTHALQDQDIGLGELRSKFVRSTDSSLSIRSLVEGEATVVSNMVMVRARGIPVERIDWNAYEGQLSDEISSHIAESDVPFLAALQLLPYSKGFARLIGPWREGGPSLVREFYDRPFTSLVDWNTGVALGVTAVEPLLCTPSGAPAGFTALGHDTFGPAAVLALNAANGAIGSGVSLGSRDFSGGMRGDTVVVFRRDADVAVAWTTRWTDSAYAGRFQKLVATAMPRALVNVRESEVDVHVATAPEALPAWDFACGTPAELPDANQDETMESAVVRRLVRRGLHAVPSHRAERPHDPRQ